MSSEFEFHYLTTLLVFELPGLSAGSTLLNMAVKCQSGSSKARARTFLDSVNAGIPVSNPPSRIFANSLISCASFYLVWIQTSGWADTQSRSSNELRRIHCFTLNSKSKQAKLSLQLKKCLISRKWPW
jgi:hypothetical protein